MTKYLQNCFPLLLPVIFWNILLVDQLPVYYQSSFFWDDIPNYISWPENILRIILFSMPMLMILEMKDKSQKMGLQLFIYGLGIYFLSWIMQMKFPTSFWSLSILGFTAPAYTSIFFIIPIGLIGKNNFFRIKYLQKTYFLIGLIFVLFHTWHAVLVYQRIY